MAWDLQLTSPLITPDLSYRLAGSVHAQSGEEGASVRVQSLETGWTEEVFLNAASEFELMLELTPDSDHQYELNACDSAGRVATCTRVLIQHRSSGSADGGEETVVPASRQTGDPASVLEPPWPVCIQRIRHCLHLAASVAQATGRNRDELIQYVHAQERYAEQATKESNPAQYRECLDNLNKYAAYLEQMRDAAQPQPLQSPPQVMDADPREMIEKLRISLAAVWKEARGKQRADLEGTLKDVAAQAQGLGQRCKVDAGRALDEARQLLAQVEATRQLLDASEQQPVGDPLPSSQGVPGEQRLAD